MIYNFLSERSLLLHKEYLEQTKLKYSILEKSFPQIVGKNIFEIEKMRVPYKKEILSLKCNVICHEMFFDSFGAKNQTSKCIKNIYGSEATFLYKIFEGCKESEGGFVFVSTFRGGAKLSFGAPELILKLRHPVLAIDLYEHSYFLDFGFNREEYVKQLLPYLNLNKVV